MPLPITPAISAITYYLLSQLDSTSTSNSTSYSTILSSILRPALTLTKWLFGLSLTHYLSSELTYFARNNWTLSDKHRWIWKEEIAVVTGGCSGIGEEVARRMAKRGVKVVVLDVADFPERLENGKLVCCEGVSTWRLMLFCTPRKLCLVVMGSAECTCYIHTLTAPALSPA
jgi:hypothetical protein